ncbi:MAG: VaFE repeat-containing surface-anchored protein [Bilifractor sp.]
MAERNTALDAGRKYTIHGYLMDQDENKEYTDSDGNKVDAYVTFTISADGRSLTVDNDTKYTYSLKGGKASAGFTAKFPNKRVTKKQNIQLIIITCV